MEDLTGGDVNPLKSDPDLVMLLKKLDSVKKYKSFQRWKTKFLDRLETFLYEEGMKPADKACTEFEAMLKKFVKGANKVQLHIEKGEISDSRKTVKATLALNEMCTSLTNVVSEVETLIPSRKKEEQKCGFTKFHLGAALIRQGFHQYVTMKAIEDALSAIGTELKDVADKQQHDLFEAYSVQVQRFCDVMADLNLYDVMMKCLEFQEEPEEEESSSAEPVTYIITVETHDGTTLTLELEPTDTIGGIKAAIAGECRLEPDRQVIRFNGAAITDDDQTLEDLGIQDGDKLTVEPFRIPVKVRTLDGNVIEITVDPTDYLSEIKRQLEEESGMPAKNQRLLLEGEELDDPNKIIGDYGINAGSVLDLEPKTINVSVQTPDGKMHTIEVKSSDTSDEIKSSIADATGMAAPRQVLKFQGKELGKGQTVRDAGISDGSELTVDIYKVPISVNNADGTQFKLMVEPTDYLSDIKLQLEQKSGVPAKNQKLSLSGEELVDPNRTAVDYGIEAGTVLDLEPKSIDITIQMPDGSIQKVQVKSSDTADSIKAKISSTTGMAAPRQVLSFEGQEIHGGRSVKDLGITDGSELTVDIFKIPVTVETPDGSTLALVVEPTDSVDTVKKLIEKETGQDKKRQNLKFGEAELADGHSTLKECGVGAGSVLVLELDADPIVFVDIKCGTLFAMEREDVIKNQALTPYQSNKLDFAEAAKGSASKEKILQYMKDSKHLGFSNQVVVAKEDVEDYEMLEAEKVKNMWGVNLKKRERNKKGEEFVFVDLKTGACGELARKKYVDMNFITPVKDDKGMDTLEEREKDFMAYDKYISELRRVFGVKFE